MDSASQITIVVNGKPYQLPPSSTLEQLITHMGLDGKLMGVAVNGEFVSRQKRNSYTISDGDTIEILSPVSGG